MAGLTLADRLADEIDALQGAHASLDSPAGP
jgi:hypothetical protein